MLRTPREHIEPSIREFLEPDYSLDIDEKIEQVTKLYQRVRQAKQDDAARTVMPPRDTTTGMHKSLDILCSNVLVARGDKRLVKS